MLICLTSDLHGTLPDTPECDLLVIAGDVAPDFGSFKDFGAHTSNMEQRLWLEGNFAPWLESRPGNPTIVGIAGNHDFALQADEGLARALPWNYLLDEPFEFGDLKLYGLPWVPNLSRWAFHGDDATLDAKYAAVPAGTDIVVSHGPPWGRCDKTVPNYGEVHVGSVAALECIRRARPRLFVCGHIHEGYGCSMIRHEPSDATEWTLVCNVALMNEDYDPVGAPALFEAIPFRGRYVWDIGDLPPTRSPVPMAPTVRLPVGAREFGYA